MTSFSVSNKPFITSMLLDEVQSLLFDFATSEPCASGAPPRMKIGLSMIFRVYQAIFKGVSKAAMSPNLNIYNMSVS